MPGAARLGDLASVPNDAHGCPACPHPGTGPVVTGSPDVFINSLAAARQDDLGVHAICCGPNTFTCAKGSPDVYVNSKPLMRNTDKTTHCGGNGNLKQGSPDVLIDDGAGGGTSVSATQNTITIKTGTTAATQQGQKQQGNDSDEDETDDKGQADQDQAQQEQQEKAGSIASAGWSQQRAYNGGTVNILIECKDPKGQLHIEVWAVSSDNTQDKSVKKLPDAAAASQVSVSYKIDIPPDAAGTNECHFYFIVKDDNGGQKKSEPIFVDRTPLTFSA